MPWRVQIALMLPPILLSLLRCKRRFKVQPSGASINPVGVGKREGIRG